MSKPFQRIGDRPLIARRDQGNEFETLRSVSFAARIVRRVFAAARRGVII
jgi:hypothetical protein